METTFIYFLKDPANPKKGYVGKSGDPQKRLLGHIKECRNEAHRRANWLKSLTARGLKPALEIIDEVSFEHWKQLEVAYIEFFLEQGYELTNSTPGGEDPPRGATLGKACSTATRDKISASLKGKKLSLTHRAKISAGGKGRNFSTGHRAKLSAAGKGRKFSPEHCAKISVSHKGKKYSPEVCAKMRGRKCSAETRSKMREAHKRRHALAKLNFPNE